MVLFDTEIILLVEYLNMRKRIKVFDTDDLKELIETAFSASPVKLPQEYLVQCFDSEIQDYLDLDDEKVLEVNNKIKILPVYDVSLNESLSRSFNEPCAAQPDMNKENDESSSKNEKLVKEPDENVEKLSTFSCGSSSNTKPWPHPFIIKDKMVRPSTLKLLQQKVKLTTADVTSLFSSILDEVIEYTYYPTPWQYMELTMAILVKWPHLMNAYPTELDAKWAWKKKLREFFRNTRKRKCGQLPEIILMKSKFSKQPKKDAAHEIKGAVRSSNVWGVKNHLPACDPGEDDEPWRCIDEPRTLVKQYNVHHYNRKMSVLQVAMNKTFSWRRKLIIEDGCSVAELFDKFPLLKEPRQHLSKNAAKIIRLQPPKLHIDPNLMETISCEATCDEKYQMSMVLLPHLLREDASNLFQNFGKKTFVQICATGHVPTLSDVFRTGATYRVVIDGNETDATDSLIMAFEVVFALHYLFNLAYPTCLEAFFSFIQKHIIKLKVGTAPNSKALKLISKLNEI